MRVKNLIAVVLMVLILALGREAVATLVTAMGLEDLVRDANVIVKVRVLAKDTQDDPEESGMVATYFTLQVLDTLKGSVPDDGELVIKQVAQGNFTSASGRHFRQNFFFPEYTVGKTYLLFLPEAHERTGMLAPVGLQQGVFEVKTVAGQELVPQLGRRSRFLTRGLNKDSKGGRYLIQRLSTMGAGSTYESFKQLIQAVEEK